MQLNCDLGESYGAWQMPVDEAIMGYIDQANIACGYHGGDPLAMQRAIQLAKRHSVSVGAHPSYPDLQGFGRRSMHMAHDELVACLHYQIAALQGMAKCQGVSLDYVKPHGALYNDMMRDAGVRASVMQAVASFTTDNGEPLPLMLQAHPNYKQFLAEAEKFTPTLLFEAFADRRYTDEGLLVSRRQANAVLSEQEAIAQAIQMMDKHTITSENGVELAVKIDTLCVHGDSPGAVAMAQQLRIELTKRRLGHS